VSRPAAVRWLAGACAALAALIAVGGCDTTREKAPTAPAGQVQAQVTGTVNRSGAALAAFKVKLYDDTTGLQVDSTFTDAAGAYGFSGVPAGSWMVKVSPVDPGDLGYVRYFFTLSAAGQTAAIPSFDVSAHGIGLVTPADSVSLSTPSFSSPLHFSWAMYQATFLWMNARVSDMQDVLVWGSPQGQATSADWNGLGNDGIYAGAAAPAGTYQWRVKLHLGNGVQAATRVRLLVLQ
jgi:hypothetical protein